LISDTDFHYFDDKETVTADPTNANYAYYTWDRITYDQATFNYLYGPAWFSRSTDGGQTWEAPRIIYQGAVGSQTLGNQIVVLPNGTLLDVFNYFDPSGNGTYEV